MWNCFGRLWKDDSGALVSIELILIITIAVLALVVGWSEVAHAVNTELDDISNAIGHFQQSYFFSGFGSYKMSGGGPKAFFRGSSFFDLPDDCDGNCSGFSTITCAGPGVCGGYGGFGGGYTVQQYGGPPLVAPAAPCLTVDCLPDHVVPGGPLLPIPDQGPPQSQPQAPQPIPQQAPRP